uniref:Calponin-homology (CH) domain-containing protein n=1 Tax=Nelumbo nucifera TaxID=4432 RepID=A0A822XL05_NELNU|nr:TPA_asm: hypothetical protein HUJ06_022513 [Nelumbo nucifera]
MTLIHTISGSEKTSYVSYINNYLAEDQFLKRYLPIDPSTNDLFEIVKGGVLLCKLINVAVPGTTDERAINTKRVLNPWERNENLTLCLDSAKAIGCTVVNIGTQDFIEGKLFHIFLKQFLLVYKNWVPAFSLQLPDIALSTSGEYSSNFDDVIVGCSAGHPTEIILILAQEIAQLTALVGEC